MRDSSNREIKASKMGPQEGLRVETEEKSLPCMFYRPFG